MKILDRYIEQLLEKSSPQMPVWVGMSSQASMTKLSSSARRRNSDVLFDCDVISRSKMPMMCFPAA